MILCIDVGNTQIHGGVFDQDNLKFQFRKTSPSQLSSDEFGLFFKSVLRENSIEPQQIEQISFCSVVPNLIYSLRSACIKYFNVKPFCLQAGTKTGLQIKYRNPLEVGADRISNAVAATHLFPNENLIITDFGTATTLCVVSKDKQYLGGAILPGLKLSMDALEAKTAKLPSVEIVRPKEVVGRSTVESIQSGLYYGQLGMVKEMFSQIKNSNFQSQDVKLVATGGFSSLYEKENIFDIIQPDLALKGLFVALKMNT